ncbi:MAG: hypothetical protein ACOYOS_25370, partial [Syntrophales bacterium]
TNQDNNSFHPLHKKKTPPNLAGKGHYAKGRFMPVIALWENRRSCFANRPDSVSGWLGKLDRGPSSLAARPPSSSALF